MVARLRTCADAACRHAEASAACAVEHERVLADLVERGERTDDAARSPCRLDAASSSIAEVDDPLRGRDAEPERVQQLGAPAMQRPSSIDDRLDGGACGRRGRSRSSSSCLHHIRGRASTAAVICG